MAEQRYLYVPREAWPWIGPALRGIDADLKTLEASGGGESAVTDLTAVYNTAKA